MFVHWIEWMSEADRLAAAAAAAADIDVGGPFGRTVEPLDSLVVAKHPTFLKKFNDENRTEMGPVIRLRTSHRE
jgi:hypothetical protein